MKGKSRYFSISSLLILNLSSDFFFTIIEKYFLRDEKQPQSIAKSVSSTTNQALLGKYKANPFSLETAQFENSTKQYRNILVNTYMELNGCFFFFFHWISSSLVSLDLYLQFSRGNSFSILWIKDSLQIL